MLPDGGLGRERERLKLSDLLLTVKLEASKSITLTIHMENVLNLFKIH